MRNRAIFTIIIFIAFSVIAQAQLIVGGQLGGALTNLTTPSNLIHSAKWNYRLGFSASLIANISISDNIMFQPELQYIQKGINVDVSTSNPADGWKTAITNSYIEIPLYLKWKLGGHSIQWFVLGGPTVGYLLSSNYDVTGPGRPNGSFDSKDLYKSYDLTISVGAGFEYPLSGGYYLVPTLSYHHGIIVVDQPAGSAAVSQSYSRNIQLTVGILFPLFN